MTPSQRRRHHSKMRKAEVKREAEQARDSDKPTPLPNGTRTWNRPKR